MANAITGVSFEPGFIILTDERGNRTSHGIADVLRALDIPTGLTHEQVSEISKLANLVVVVVRTLIARGILDEHFLEDGEYDLEAIVQSIEDMGGDFGEPDISV